ncbi:hypothetical protein SISNIDRAFT_534021 [Sistotremastrum niveocremeum HHB9708]|uniref:Peptidase C14 caspase domain-containing protein n=1 Tax=Sistotremastrum niveocremeum HHB9708 TaxID=1314777 RepID=A0A164YFE3_9AGAM|nr:hypothetical protein SISNIDRAFT_534021 [Sistotremastrum niveocremeum HHB9708]
MDALNQLTDWAKQMDPNLLLPMEIFATVLAVGIFGAFWKGIFDKFIHKKVTPKAIAVKEKIEEKTSAVVETSQSVPDLISESLPELPELPPLELKPIASKFKAKFKPRTSYPRMFALIIGINQYQNVKQLTGAVADSEAVENFLKDELSVPAKRIVTLRDSAATRDAIIRAIQSLATNPDIEKNDPIVIYYAGLGASVKKPTGWDDWISLDNKVELLCPYDLGAPPDAVEYDPQLGIPDRTIAALLTKISAEKGDNITVVLDCCHSARINDKLSLDGAEARLYENAPPIDADCDHNIWAKVSDGPASGVSASFVNQKQGSQILLAACHKDELAWEKDGRGLFTKRLLRLLDEIHVGRTDYATLMRKSANLAKHAVPGQSQSAICQGIRIHRKLFSQDDIFDKKSFVSGQTEDGKIVLNAGTAQGLRPSVRVDIYEDNDPSSSTEKIVTLVVSEIAATRALLTLPPGSTETLAVPAHFYGRIPERHPDDMLVVHCNKEQELRALLSPVLEEYHLADFRAAGIDFTAEADSADFEVTMDGAEVSYDMDLKSIYDGTPKPKILRTTQITQPEKILDVLLGAVHFKFFLNQKNESDLKIDSDKVPLHFHRLLRTWNKKFQSEIKPNGPNLLRDNVVKLKIPDTGKEFSTDGPFGFTIRNNTDLPLHPYLFAFDLSDLSIKPWNLSASEHDALLLPKAKFPVGYGDSGSQPWGFTLDKAVKSDVTFFKLFVTSRHTDFSAARQESPFVSSKRDGQVANMHNTLPDVWGTVIVTAAQEHSLPIQEQIRR